MEYKESEVFRIKDNPEIDEKRIQGIIKANPSILGLGDLTVREVERKQPSKGRLDLLLENRVSKKRYEVELQLGPTDPSHIIRTIEYWLNEKRKSPQYQHVAVIVAEDLTSRFYNVIDLLNKEISLEAIQMNGLKLNDDEFTLSFTKVLSLTQFGSDEENEKATRQDWLKKGTEATVELADKLLTYINEELDESYELNYTKAYIGPTKGGFSNNFAVFSPQKKAIILRLKLEKSAEIDTFLKGKFSKWKYRDNWEKYILYLSADEVTGKRRDLLYLLRKAYDALNR